IKVSLYGDPIATNIVMKYAKNVSVYPLNVTQQALITPEMETLLMKREEG
ncbi:nucleoside hydrolase, partial [Bacillus pseudomycoides]